MDLIGLPLQSDMFSDVASFTTLNESPWDLGGRKTRV
jgi:hypothetical protein